MSTYATILQLIIWIDQEIVLSHYKQVYWLIYNSKGSADMIDRYCLIFPIYRPISCKFDMKIPNQYKATIQYENTPSETIPIFDIRPLMHSPKINEPNKQWNFQINLTPHLLYGLNWNLQLIPHKNPTLMLCFIYRNWKEAILLGKN